MGCGGSKAAGSTANRKGGPNDNKIQKDAGLAPLDQQQLKSFNDWWNMIFVIPKGGQAYMPSCLKPLSEILKDGTDEAQKKLFNAEDGDMDDMLNKEETIAFLKKVMSSDGNDLPSEANDLFFQRMQACVSGLNFEYGDSVKIDDFNRFKSITKVFMQSEKVDASMKTILPPEANGIKHADIINQAKDLF